jgi:alkylation response protein AidB-like acyl-CoA dehydrogenase
VIADEQVRSSLAALLPPAGQPAPWDGLDQVAAGRMYLALLAPHGWIAPTWPAAYGGRDSSEAEAAMVSRVLAEFAAPDLYPFSVGLAIVGPTLMRHGTPEQRERWCTQIVTGADIWCQMFSEPGAGSDLAGLSTRAVPSASGWIVSGQKVWTSRGEYATLGFCLARTDPDVPKHQGLTMFALPMDLPGVTVRPLIQMNGDSHFSEVFIDGCAIPADASIGEPEGGWAVAVTALAFERATTMQRQVAPDPLSVPAWLDALAADGSLADDAVRRTALDAFVLYASNAIFDSYAAEVRGRGGPAAIGSVSKLYHVATFKALAELGHLAAGPEGMLASDASAYDLLTAPSMSIRGGTDQIQRNIVGERVLGLPRDPHRDNDVPWNQRGRTRPD